jgi:hypothetical protein
MATFQVFLTCRDTLQCVHEPFGDAWYFGPERLSDRFEKNESARVKSGFSGTTYQDVFADIEAQNIEVGSPPSRQSLIAKNILVALHHHVPFLVPSFSNLHCPCGAVQLVPGQQPAADFVQTGIDLI